MFLVIMFLEQWVVLEFLLLLSGRILKRNGPKHRIMLAAVCGSLAGCIGVFIPQSVKCPWLLLSVAITAKTAFKVSGKKLFYFTGYLLAAAAMFGGIWNAVRGQSGGWIWIAEFALSIGIFIFIYKMVWMKFKMQKDFLYEVTFQWQKEKFQVCGFLDTGNFLYEPLSKMPVCVMEEAVFLEHFREPLTKMIEKYSVKDIRMIPYHSVGTETGIMPGILVTDIQITNGSQKIEVTRGIVGISKEELSKSGHYQLLLHPDLIKCGRL